jgi:hypothetical protein
MLFYAFFVTFSLCLSQQSVLVGVEAIQAILADSGIIGITITGLQEQHDHRVIWATTLRHRDKPGNPVGPSLRRARLRFSRSRLSGLALFCSRNYFRVENEAGNHFFRRRQA